jgi:hypothetical protein
MCEIRVDTAKFRAELDKANASLAKWLNANRCAITEDANAAKCRGDERRCGARDLGCRRRGG